MQNSNTLRCTMAALLVSSVLYSCGTTNTPPTTSPGSQIVQKNPTKLHTLSNLPEQSEVISLMQKLQNIGWIGVSQTGIYISAANVVLKNNVQTALTNLSMKYFDDYVKFAVMTENANIEDVIQIIDIMLHIVNETVLEMVKKAPSDPQSFEDVVYYATCQHDLLKRGRGCELSAGENPYENVGTPQNPLPSKTAECTPSVQDCRTYIDNFGGNKGVYATLDNENNFELLLEAEPGLTPSGETIWNQAWNIIGPKVNCIIGNWYGGTISDNLDSFNAGLQNFLTPIDAAKQTFTGKMAVNKGFTQVTIISTIGYIGEYTEAHVKFCRP